MSECAEDAHCSEDSAEASYPTSAIHPAYANFAFTAMTGIPFYPSLSEDPGKSTASPGPTTSRSPTFVRTISLKDWGTKQNQAVETMEPEEMEHALQSERVGERLLRLTRPVHEPFDPEEFVRKAVDFLASIGSVHVASLEVDGTSVYVFQEDAGSDSASVAEEKAKGYFGSHKGPVQQIDLKVFGKSDHFFLEMVLTYRPVHSPHEAAFTLAIAARPVVLHAMKGETYEQYADRTEKLRTDPVEAANFEKEVDERGKELVRDLSYHISTAFPGARFTVIEQNDVGDLI